MLSWLSRMTSLGPAAATPIQAVQKFGPEGIGYAGADPTLIGLLLAARRPHQLRFVWLGGGCGAPQSLTRAQLNALALVLSWQHMGKVGVNTLVWRVHCRICRWRVEGQCETLAADDRPRASRPRQAPRARCRATARTGSSAADLQSRDGLARRQTRQAHRRPRPAQADEVRPHQRTAEGRAARSNRRGGGRRLTAIGKKLSPGATPQPKHEGEKKKPKRTAFPDRPPRGEVSHEPDHTTVAGEAMRRVGETVGDGLDYTRTYSP